MKKLQQKIKQLKTEINKNNQKMRMQSHIIKKFTHSTAFVLTGAVGGFIGGYLIGKRQNVPQLINTVKSASGVVRTVKRAVKLLAIFMV